MRDANKVSEQLIDMAERFADVVDAAEGRGGRKNSVQTKWLVLPAAGAAVYALATSSSGMARQTRAWMRRAKDRATDLPDADLFNRVKEVSGTETPSSSSRSSGSSTRSTTRSSSSRSRSSSGSSRRGQTRRKTASSRSS